MHSYELSLQLETISMQLKNDNFLVMTLEQFSKTYIAIMPEVSKVIGVKEEGIAAQDVVSLNNQAKSQLKRAIIEFKKIQLMTLTREIHQLDEILQRFYLPGTERTLHELQQQLMKFAQSYEEYTREYSLSLALQMLSEAYSLYMSIIALRQILIEIQSHLQKYFEIPENMMRLKLFWEVEMDFYEFSQKMYALQAIYQELAVFFRVSTEQYPLKIIKIESGCPTLTDVFGHAKIVELIADTIKSVFRFMRRKYTDEGKKEVLREDLTTLSLFVDFQKKAETLGLNVSAMDAYIQNSGIVLMQKYAALIAGQPVLEINNERLSVENGLRARYIQESNQLVLETFKEPKELKS